VERVHKAQADIYRLLGPERASLSLVSDEHGHWEIGQLLVSHNRRLQSETKEVMEAWLGDYTIRPQAEHPLPRSLSPIG
jgi:hypothetical protein